MVDELTHCIHFFFFQAEDGIRDIGVTGVQTCALPIWYRASSVAEAPSPRTSRRGTGSPDGHRPAAARGSTTHRPSSRRVDRGTEERRVGEEGKILGVADYLKKKEKRRR